MLKNLRNAIVAMLTLGLILNANANALGQGDQRSEVFVYLNIPDQPFQDSARQLIGNTPPTDVHYTVEALKRLQKGKAVRDPKSNVLRLTQKLAPNVSPYVQLDLPLGRITPLRVYVVAVTEPTDNGNVESVAVVRFYKKGVTITVITGGGASYHDVDPQQKSLADKSLDATKEGLKKTKEKLNNINPWKKKPFNN